MENENTSLVSLNCQEYDHFVDILWGSSLNNESYLSLFLCILEFNLRSRYGSGMGIFFDEA